MWWSYRIDWPVVGALASATYTIAFVISIAVLVKQLKATRNALYGQTFVAAVNLHDAPDAVRARATVWACRDEPAETRFNGLVEDIRGNPVATRADDARTVCVLYQTIGTMVLKGMLPYTVVHDLWGHEIADQWYSVKWFVATERKRLRDPKLWIGFEILARVDENLPRQWGISIDAGRL